MKTNLILVIVLITISTAAYWFEFRKKTGPDPEIEGGARLSVLDQNAQLDSLRIVVADRKIDYQIKCRENCKTSDPNGRWELESPIQFKADEGNVGSFVTSVFAANVQETLPFEGDKEAMLEKFGLGRSKRDSFKAEFRFKGETEPVVLYVGESAAVGDNMYVYLQDPRASSKGRKDAIRIVGSYLKSNLERNLSYWRAKRLLGFAASEVERIQLSNQHGTTVLEKSGSDWLMGSKKQLADNEAVDTFVTGLVFMSAHEFISDSKSTDKAKNRMTGKAHYRLQVKPAKKPEVEIEIWDVLIDKLPKLYGTISDKSFIFELDRTHAEKFAKKPSAFRFHNLITAAEKEETARFEVSFPASKADLKLEKSGEGWKLSSGTVAAFDSSAADQALVKVGAARIAEFIEKGGIPAAAKEISSWALFDKSGSKRKTFSVYASKDRADYYVKLASGEVAKLERGSGSAVPSAPGDFEKKTASAPPPTQQTNGPDHGHSH